jgi:hypothetical protein
MASNMTTLDEKRKRRATADYCPQPLRVFGKSDQERLATLRRSADQVECCADGVRRHSDIVLVRRRDRGSRAVSGGYILVVVRRTTVYGNEPHGGCT